MSQPAVPSNAILTVPNVLTFIRLGLAPLFLWAGLGMENIGLAFAIAFFGLVTDLLDGKIARHFGQVSKLGILLDPLADRLALAAGAVVLLVQDLAPWWAVATVLGRDVVLVVVGAPLLKARGLPIPPVTKVGKAGSFLTSLCFGTFLASGISDVSDPNDVVRAAALILFAFGGPLYWAAGVGYMRVGLATLRNPDAR